MQNVPMTGFIGMDSSAGGRAGLNEGNAVSFRANHGSQGVALALSADDDDTALAGLVFGLAAVNAVFGLVRRADVAAEVCSVNLDLAVKGGPSRHCGRVGSGRKAERARQAL